MARIPSTNPADWHRVPGSSGRYRYKNTDITISRRQYDKHIGSLARAGFSSYEQRQKVLNIQPQEYVSPKFGFRSTGYQFSAADPIRATETVIQHFGLSGKRINLRAKTSEGWRSSYVTTTDPADYTTFFGEMLAKYAQPGEVISEYELVAYDD